MFFPDDFSEHIFTTVAPYTERAGKARHAEQGRRHIAPGGSVCRKRPCAKRDSAYEALMVIAVTAG